MQNKCRCKCGSSKVVFVIQKGRGKKSEAFCEKCLPVETIGEEDNILKSSERLNKR